MILTPREKRVPVQITEELFSEILERVAAGELVTDICATQGMPSWSSLSRYINKSEERQAAYDLSRELCADFLAAQVVEMANSASDCQTMVQLNALKLRCEAARWYLRHMHPRRYGEKLELDHKGSIQTTPITINVVGVKAQDGAGN